jgi:lipopolysaccharide transport protein LptA
MPSSSPNCRRRGPFAVLMLTIALLFLQTATPAAQKCETTEWKVDYGESSRLPSGDLSFEDLKFSQCSTLLHATKAEASGIAESIRNSTWKLTGRVHLEFDVLRKGSEGLVAPVDLEPRRAVLDADAATVVFVNNRVSSVTVQATSAPPSRQPKKPVQVKLDDAQLDVDTAVLAFAEGRVKTIQAKGSPAIFSHVVKKTGRRAQGRANNLNYDASENQVQLRDDIWLSDGRLQNKTQLITYNLSDGSYSSPGPGSVTNQPEERVPAPRTPDRATAQ